MPRTVKNSDYVCGLIILVVKYRMRKTLDTFPSETIENQRINLRLFRNRRECGIHCGQKHLTKTRFAILIPLVGGLDVGFRLGEKNNGLRHSQHGFVF